MPQARYNTDKYGYGPIMTRAYFRNTIIISLLGHITLFSLFSFSFGKIILKIEYAPLVFLGQILPKTDLSIYQNISQHKKIAFGDNSKRFSVVGKVLYAFPHHKNRIFNKRPDTSLLDNVNSGVFSATVPNLKPAVPIGFNKEKSSLLPAVAPLVYLHKRKESVIMFHPLLPYQLQLYFKDRQVVHIELMFNIISGREKKSILIKRRISSGNLEADLLSARYIGHYLFIQQARFQPNNWQTVKIDLSTQK